MSRKLTPRTSLEHLKREAKRWLKALRAGDPTETARFAQSHPDAPQSRGLRDVQHALAREYGFPGWNALRQEVERRGAAAFADASPEDPVQALLAAAFAGDAARVEAVLDAHPDIVSERGVLEGHTGRRTALHFALDGPHMPVIDVLLARGADPNVRDEGDNAMPLHFAAERGRLDIVRKLIEHGADPVGTDDYHELDVIGWAACFGDAPKYDVVDYLLAHGANHTMFSSVATGATDAIREIDARSPADRDRPMDTTNHRRRPLHLAIVKRQPASLRTLLELGADTEAQDAAGLTPLDQAALGSEREMANMLREYGARIRLPAAIALELQADVERLLKEEPDSLRPGGRWGRLILRASERAPAHVIEAMLRGGASVHVRDDHRTAVDQTHGYTPLHAAAFNGNADAVRVLLAHGANPADREDRYLGTPAGWANHAGHTQVRDIILEGPIDIFDAISFDRTGRLTDVLRRDPYALDRRFGEYVAGTPKVTPWNDPAWTPIAFAIANGRTGMVRTLIERGADLSVRDSSGRTLLEIAELGGHAEIAALLRDADAHRPPGDVELTFDERVAEFLRRACLDWRVGGSQRARQMYDADRLRAGDPGITRANVYTAVVCGALDEVGRIVNATPGVVSEIGGPRSWPPLLYLCAARLPSPESSDNAVAIAKLLLDRGADPNAFYLGGNADIHYTALTIVLGRGEEQATMHSRARELVRLLLEHGANPLDSQVLYNVFADHASRQLLDDDIVWLLDLMYVYSARRGHAADWADPAWPMFDLWGAPSLGHEERRRSGAHFMLDAAIDRNLLGLAEWMLAHGAGPDTPGDTAAQSTQLTLYQKALALGYTEMAGLLVRYGATPTPLTREGYDAFMDAALKVDRDHVRDLAALHPEYLEKPRALFTAVEQDRVDAVELLLDAGVSPNVEEPAEGGRRALHVAAYAGAARSAALLIARGADIDARETRYGAIPLGVASWSQQPALIELLGRYSRDIWELTYTGRVDRLREVLREEPERARIVGSSGDTPLMWLPSDTARAIDATQLLLAHGADPGQRNAQGVSAADIAARRGLDDVVALLRAHGR